MKVESNVLDRQFRMFQAEYEQKALEVLRGGWYVLGGEVKAFEEEFAAYVGARHCVGLASGLDALWNFAAPVGHWRRRRGRGTEQCLHCLCDGDYD